jgi:hypothetical protein
VAAEARRPISTVQSPRSLARHPSAVCAPLSQLRKAGRWHAHEVRDPLVRRELEVVRLEDGAVRLALGGQIPLGVLDG